MADSKRKPDAVALPVKNHELHDRLQRLVGLLLAELRPDDARFISQGKIANFPFTLIDRPDIEILPEREDLRVLAARWEARGGGGRRLPWRADAGRWL